MLRPAVIMHTRDATRLSQSSTPSGEGDDCIGYKKNEHAQQSHYQKEHHDELAARQHQFLHISRLSQTWLRYSQYVIELTCNDMI